jgi:2',3'-cyclic-nucleotide 2'-phosphodiesterase (5'-nucleotidase family)
MVGMATPGNLAGFYSLEPAKVVNDIVAEIDPSTDLIIVLSHLGYDNDVELAGQIKNVDLIIGGHSHRRILTPELVNKVLIVQAGSYTRNLGRLDLTVAGDTVMSYAGKLITTFVEGTNPQPELQAFADSFAAIIDEAYGVEIGRLESQWRSAYREESNVGNWITDVIRHAFDADVAFINSGGIRKNEMPVGPITMKDIAEMLPFANYIETFEVTGDQLIQILTENARAQGLETHGILQVSGVSYSWKTKGDDVALVKVRVGGQKVKKDRTYKIASIDYVNVNHDRYYKYEPTGLNNTGVLLSDLIIKAVKNAKSINAKVEGRISQVE